MKKIMILKYFIISFLLVVCLYCGLLYGGIFFLRHNNGTLFGTYLLSIIPLPKSTIQSQLNNENWFVRYYTIMALRSSIVRSKKAVLPLLRERLSHEGDELCRFELADAIVSYGDTLGMRKVYTEINLHGLKRVAEARKRLENLDKK